MISQRPKDWVAVAGIVITVSLIVLYFAEKWIPELSGATVTVLFLLMVGIIIYSVLALNKRYKITNVLTLNDLLLYGGIIALLVFGILQFKIFPQFSIASIASQNIASIFGGA